MHRIDGPGATVDNKFTDGDPVGGVQATVVTDDWLNDVQEELLSVLAAVGITPVKGTQNQILAAIRRFSGGFSALAGFSTSQTLAAGNIGQLIFVIAGGTTQTLPPIAGAPSGSSLSFAVYGQTTIKGNGSESIINLYGNSSSNTIQVSAGERITLTSNGATWYIAAYDRAEAGAPVGTATNLKVSVTSPTAITSLTADEIIVGTALGGPSYRLSAFNSAINLGINGAAGMDVGSAPINGWVAIYAIYNPISGQSRLLGVNATSVVAPTIYGGANMPAGFTASALVSVWGTNASGQFQVGFQTDREIHTLPFAILASSVATLSVTSISLASAVPLNAKKGFFKTTMSQGSGGNVGFVIQPHVSLAIHTLILSTTIALSQSTIVETLPIMTPQLFYFSTQTSNAGNYNMFLHGYIF